MKRDNAPEVVIATLCILNPFLDLLRDHCIDRCMMNIRNIDKDQKVEAEEKRTKRIKKIKKIKNTKKTKMIRKKNKKMFSHRRQVKREEL
jgi:hypothetical protein